MKISKISKTTTVIILSVLLAYSNISCAGKKTQALTSPEPVQTQQEESPVKEEPVQEVKETKPAPEPLPEPVKKEEPVIQEEPAQVTQEPVVQNDETDDEYLRSVGDVAVDKSTFVDDKEKVLQIIKKLDNIMKDMDYKSWLTYVDNESIQYWSKPANLRKAQNRLPIKGIRLNTLQDYFKFVFVPARKGREVTEIRYISDTYIKAIQAQKEQDIVYYYFNKINGHWMVHLPPIDN